MTDERDLLIRGAKVLGGEPQDVLIDGERHRRGRRRSRRRGRDRRRGRRPDRCCPASSTCTPTCASPAARTPRRSLTGTTRRRGRRLHRGLRHGEHLPGRRHRRRRRAGAGGSAGSAGYCDVQPIGAVTVGLEGEQLAELGAMADSRRRRAGLLRRRQVRRRRGDHAPRAGVREGVRRRHRPARAGAAAHRGRPDERGRRLRPSSASPAGPPSPRSRSSPATCCSPSTSAPALHVCHLSTAGSVEIVRWAKSRGIDVTAEVTPHHLLLTDELVRALRPGLQGEPAAAHRGRRRWRCARRSPTAPSTSSPPTTPRTRTRTRTASGPRPPSGMVGLETALSRRASRRWSTPGCSTGPASRDGCRARPRASAALAGHGRPLAAGEPANLTLVDPAHRGVVDPTRLRLAQPQHALPGPRAAGPGRRTPSCGAAPRSLDGKLA